MVNRSVADPLGQFTAKQLNRQAAKAGKDEQTEKGKLKKVLKPSPDLPFRRWSRELTSPSIIGDPTRPWRHREGLRPKQHPQTERETQSPQARQPDRCSKLTSGDCCDHEAGQSKHGERCAGNGCRNEDYGFGESIHPILPTL